MKAGNDTTFPLSALLVLLFFFMSCNRDNIYSDNEKIPGYIWDADSIITFKATVVDTVNAFDINLVIRTDNTYDYRNLFLFITTMSPERHIISDTVEYYLADEKGKWYGSGLGDINDLSVPFKTNILFPSGGTYTFSIQQAMRDKALRGITDIGIQIKKHKQ